MENEKTFDLNIEKILENWKISDGIREIIANALDEQILTETNEVEIYKDKKIKNCWHIRDYGRGIDYKHFTQNENDEKLKNVKLIGQFGIGLKDALATFYRKGIKISIISKHLEINKLEMKPKIGFNDLDTLNVLVNNSKDKTFKGTQFTLIGITDDDMQEAQKLFLKFLDLKVLNTNKIGQIIKKDKTGEIFLNGLKIAEEQEFLFTYNITSKNKAIKKALNRERTNVGRTAYTDRVKAILKNCTDEKVLTLLAKELSRYVDGVACEEAKWIDVQKHTIKHLATNEKYIFISPRDLDNKGAIDEIRNSGKYVFLIPDNLKISLSKMTDINGNEINTLEKYIEDSIDNFEYNFISEKDMNKKELKIFKETTNILNLLGGRTKNIKNILISETMQKDTISFMEILGLWKPNTGEIIIKRSELSNMQQYAGTLLHEFIHAKYGVLDITREFESELTKGLGILSKHIIE